MDIDSINFLPATYQRRLTERHRLWRHGVLLAMLCVCLGAWWQVQRGQTQRLRHDVAVFDQQVAAAREQMKLVTELRREHGELTNRMALWQRLGQPVSHGEIFATLADQLPPAVVLTRLDVKSQRAAQTAAPVESRSRRTTSRTASSATAALPVDRLELDLTGIAPDDLTLANLLNSLNQHALFQDVKLHFSRATEVHGAAGRQFRIEMHVPLDRDYQPAPAKEGVAHAS